MTPRALALALLLAVPAGCLSLVREDDAPRALSGPVEGYLPTNSFLKVQVRDEDGRIVLADFDRRDWHVSELARRIDAHRVKHLSVEATPRDILGEVLVQRVHDPGDVGALRYEAMGATAEDRRLLDLEYEEMLRGLEAGAPAAPSPEPLDALGLPAP